MGMLAKDRWVRIILASIALLAVLWASSKVFGPSDLSLLGQLFIGPAITALLARSCFVWARLFKS
jgi:hypothetical protein